MTTTPQLPPELEKQFDEELGTLNVTHIPIRVKKNGEVMQNAGAYVKHFLAQALQDQQDGFVREVEKLKREESMFQPASIDWQVQHKKSIDKHNQTISKVLDILKGKTK